MVELSKYAFKSEDKVKEKMYDLILNIDNKEILNEVRSIGKTSKLYKSFDLQVINPFTITSLQIFHYSVDVLIGQSKRDASTAKLSHKFGFSNAEEFENTVKFIMHLYRQHVLQNITDEELISNFSHFNQDFQQCVLDVIRTRRPEVEDFLVNEYNSRENDLLASFDWDLRWVLGTNNLTTLRTQIVTLILNCKQHDNVDLNTVFMEMSREKLDRLIAVLEECDRKLSRA